MATDKLKTINRFYGGIARDDKSKVIGTASNVEELDIFQNADYMVPEQIVSSDSMPASTEIYAYTSGSDGTIYGYGKETAASKVRIVSAATGGADNPGSFSTLFTSSDTTNLATVVSDFKFFKTTEASNPSSLYYIKGTSTSWYIARYNIGAAAEQRYDGSTWTASGSWDSNSQLTGLNGSFMRPTMKVIFGELFICHGNYIAKVDSEGVFTKLAFTLPTEWEAVDLTAVSDVCIILARYIDRTVNYSKGFWWDLTADVQVDDSFDIPMGGPQWILNFKENVRFLCAINGTARIFQLSGAFPGAIPVELPGILINNVGVETTTQPISSAKMVSTKDKIMYFGLFKTDKTGIYAIGQLDSDKPIAVILSKRFATTDYSLHKPTSLYILGPNYYASFNDNGTASHCRCESNNSPSRSSNAIYETLWIDDDDAFTDKDCIEVILATYPTAASTSIALSMDSDYSGSYTAITRPDGTNYATTGAVVGYFKPKSFAKKKIFKLKLAWTSSTTNAIKVASIALRLIKGTVPGNKTN